MNSPSIRNRSVQTLLQPDVHLESATLSQNPPLNINIKTQHNQFYAKYSCLCSRRPQGPTETL
jgi:hypothetical protein